MAKGKFICGQCGKEFKRTILHVDEDGFFKSCPDPSCGTSNLTEEEMIESFSREDFRNMRVFLGISNVDEMSKKSKEELINIPFFKKEINGYKLVDFINKKQ